MMNSLKFVLTLMLTAVSATSCLKEIVVQGVGSGELALNPQVDALTKAPIAGNTFPDTRTIVLSAYNNIPGGTSADFFEGITFMKDAALSSWTGGGGTNPKYWPTTGTLDLLAYSVDGFSTALTPEYNTDNCSADVTLTVPDNSTPQVDILWTGAQDKSASPTALDLTFRHAEAAVAFNAKAENPYDSIANLGITIDSIKLHSVKSSGKVKLPVTGDCIWSELGTPKDIVLPGIPTTGYNVTRDSIGLGTNPFAIGGKGIIVLPQKATSFTVYYTVHYGRNVSTNPVDKGESFDYTIFDTNWTAGTKYVYSLEFKQDQILVSTDIFDWSEKSEGVIVQEPVSATFKNSETLAIDLGHAELSTGGVVGIDWGFGRREIIENTTGAVMDLAGLPHTYSAMPTDSVKIFVRKGTLDFGTIRRVHFDHFHVYNTAEVLMQVVTHMLIKIPVTVGGDFSLNPSPGPVREGDTVTVTPVPALYYDLDKISYNDDITNYDITSSKSFQMPITDASVTVIFKQITFDIFLDEVDVSGASFIVTKDGVKVEKGTVGESLKFEVTCPEHYSIDEMKVYKTGDDTTTVTVGTDGTFVMPSHDINCKVTFKYDSSTGGGTELTPGGLL